MNKKNNVFVLVLFSLITISACTSSIGHQVAAGNQVAGQSSVGVGKGQTPPDFTVMTIDGKEMKLSQFKNENKPILLYFWATWCPFCKQDFNVVRDIYPKYVDKVTFLAIDLDTSENAEIIKQYKNTMKLEGIDFAEGNSKILSDYDITHTTTKYAVGKDGKILYKGSGVFNEQQWEVLFNAMINS